MIFFACIPCSIPGVARPEHVAFECRFTFFKAHYWSDLWKAFKEIQRSNLASFGRRLSVLRIGKVMGGLWATPLCTPGTACESQNLESLRRVGGLSFFPTFPDLGFRKTRLNVRSLV